MADMQADVPYNIIGQQKNNYFGNCPGIMEHIFIEHAKCPE